MPEYRLLLTPGGYSEGSSLDTIALPHPRTGALVKFLVQNNSVLELKACYLPPSSWVLDKRHIISDGSLYIATPMDPLFLLVPLLVRSRNKTREDQAGYFCELSQISDEHFSPNLVARLLKEADISSICDIHDFGEDFVYRLNDSKVIEWLKLKVDRVSRALEPCADLEYSDSKDRLIKSVEIVCDYLDDAYTGKLMSAYQLNDFKIKSASILGSSSSDTVDSVEGNAKPSISSEKRKRDSNAAKIHSKLKKAAHGSQSLLGFFKKK